MRIGIIGGGISGLSAAWYLVQRGHQVDVFESAPEVGGLIGTFDFDGVRIDHFYHFLCLQDTGYFHLCHDLGIAKNIRFLKTKTGFYYDGKEYSFSSPLDLMRFSSIPFQQRIRLGLFALEARYRQEWRQLDELVAKPWLIDRTGRRTYDVIWEPLLALKFGAQHDSISAAWMWHRLHRVAKSKGRMGFLEGGTALLLDTLLARLGERGVGVHVGKRVKEVRVEDKHVAGLLFENGETFSCDCVVSTLPLPVVADIIPRGWEDFTQTLRRIEYIGIVCAVLKLKRPVSKFFWYNVHDDRLPFNGIIEYTNLNALGGDHGHIVYVPYYVGVDEPLYGADDGDVFQQSWEALKVMNPKLRDEDLMAYRVFRAPYGQAICPTGFLKMLPPRHGTIKGLHLLDSTFLYPEDRSQSGLIIKARECADMIGP